MLGSLFKLWFGGNKKAPRELNDPRDLQPGDVLQINDSFALPADLRGQSFEVTEVTTYRYGQSDWPEWTLKGPANKPVYLCIDENDGEPLACFSRKIKKKEFNALFGKHALAGIMQANAGFVLERVQEPESLAGWTAESYSPAELGAKGKWYERDLRKGGGGDYDPFTYYELYSDDEQFGVEVEVWDADEVDLCITLSRPLSDIRELWPKEARH